MRRCFVEEEEEEEAHSPCLLPALITEQNNASKVKGHSHPIYEAGVGGVYHIREYSIKHWVVSKGYKGCRLHGLKIRK